VSVEFKLINSKIQENWNKLLTWRIPWLLPSPGHLLLIREVFKWYKMSNSQHGEKRLEFDSHTRWWSWRRSNLLTESFPSSIAAQCCHCHQWWWQYPLWIDPHSCIDCNRGYWHPWRRLVTLSEKNSSVKKYWLSSNASALFEWMLRLLLLRWISMEFITHTGLSVGSLPLHACQSTGFKYEAKLIVLRTFKYRFKLNISKSSRFHIPYHIWIGNAYALTSIDIRTYFAQLCARRTSGSLIYLKIDRILPKLGDNGPLDSSCTLRKFIKIYTDVLHDMVVDYRVWLCPISNTAN